MDMHSALTVPELLLAPDDDDGAGLPLTLALPGVDAVVDLFAAADEAGVELGVVVVVVLLRVRGVLPLLLRVAGLLIPILTSFISLWKCEQALPYLQNVLNSRKTGHIGSQGEN